jgi:hypothetical protein
LSNVSTYSTTAASNNSASPNGWPEGMSPSGVNDSAREMMAALAKWYAALKGGLVTAGTSTAYTLTTGSSHATLAAIGLVVFRVHTASGAAPTLAVDGLTAKEIRWNGIALTAAALTQDEIHAAVYNATGDVYDLITTPHNIPSLKAAGLTYPTSDGSSGHYLTTNGSGTLTFAAAAQNITYSARTANTILAAGDKAYLINITANSFTQTFTAAATLGAGWYCYYKNTGTGLVTLNPDGTETIGGSTTLVLGTGDEVLIVCDGSNFQVYWGAFSGNDFASADTGNGHGGTNTMIRRFTNTSSNGGSVTYADSAANGGSFTINSPGLYEIYYSDERGTNNPAEFGISLNSAQLTTSINAITLANRLAIGSVSLDQAGSVTRLARLAVGDVIRAHTDGSLTNATATTFMSVRKIGN